MLLYFAPFKFFKLIFYSALYQQANQQNRVYLFCCRRLKSNFDYWHQTTFIIQFKNMQKRILRWTGIVLSCLIVLVLLFYGIVYLSTTSRVNKVYAVNVHLLNISNDFIILMRTGKTPKGQQLSDAMPYKEFTYTDDELKALHLYLQQIK